MNKKWTTDDIPDQSGKVIIITGANSGLGYWSAVALAQKGGHVVMACRTIAKGETAAASIQKEIPHASLQPMALDLADLASIEQFTETFKGQFDRLDVIMNNAGVMALPQRETADGFEMHFGTNHLGHFALTIRLIDTLMATPNSRVVTVSSNLHHSGKIQFDDLMSQNNYDKWAAYGQTKLANLLFAYELQRRLENAGASTISLGAHPGYSATNLQHAGPLMAGSKIQNTIMSIANRLFAQDAPTGALPQLYAAVSPDAKGGDYIGPDGFRERRGHPKKVQSSTNSHNRQTAEQLWQISETLTNLHFPPTTNH